MRRQLIVSNEEWNCIARNLGIPQRQLEIIQAFLDGICKPQAVAHRLGIQPSSVKTHIERLYRRLDVHDRVGVVVNFFIELMALRDRGCR